MNSLGTVLETARRSKGFTQAQLAEIIGTTQPSIQRYEKDIREPDGETFLAIATALGVTAEFLHHASHPESAMAMNAHMRRRASAPAAIWRRLEAELNMSRWHISSLFEEVSIQASLHMPQFDPEEFTPERCAAMVRMQWRLPLGPVRNLVSWMESAGIIVIEKDFGSSKVDGLSQWAGDHPVIIVNSIAPTDRKRLTLAHELGHLVMHMHAVGDDLEDEANAFAAAFLMPEETIKPDLRSLKLGKLVDLKREWGVSMSALVERAFQLGTMLKDERTKFYRDLSRRGWRTHEPASDELAPERPRMTEAIASSLFEANLSASDVARIIGFASPSENDLLKFPSRSLRVV